MESWCHVAARRCRPLSQCTRPLRAVFSTGVTAGAAVPEEEREEAAREAEGECTRIFGRSWTIKPGLVSLCMCYSI